MGQSHTYLSVKCLLAFFFFFTSLHAQKRKIEVAILGTFHLGSSSDFADANYDDILSKQRQMQVKEVVYKLAKWKPEKIFVENTPTDQRIWNEVYLNLQRGLVPADQKLVVNEIFQFGLQTALKLRLNGVLCVNYSDLNAKEPQWKTYASFVYGQKPSAPQLLSNNSLVKTELQKILSNHEKWKSLSLKNHLLKFNEPSNLAALQYVNTLAWMDHNENNMGAEISTLEYHRNLKILQNIILNLNSKDNKILIIIGAAHAKILKDMLDSHPVFEVVDIKKVLE